MKESGLCKSPMMCGLKLTRGLFLTPWVGSLDWAQWERLVSELISHLQSAVVGGLPPVAAGGLWS